MSGKRQDLIDAIFNKESPIILLRAVVLSVDQNYRTCAVKLFGSEMEVEDVALTAEEDAGEWGFLSPKIDSVVVIGCINNDLSNAVIVQFGEVEAGEILCGDTKINFDKELVSLVNKNSSVILDSNKATLTQGNTVVELSGGKVSVKNDQTSLKGLFDDLSTLIQNLKVITAQGPSTALFPDTLAALTQFKTKYPLLLS